jgi:hypothetical protein
MQRLEFSCVVRHIYIYIYVVSRLRVKYNQHMQHYTIFSITVNALHVSGGFSAHHQELKNCIHSIWYVPVLLLLMLVVAASKLDIYQMLCIQF